MLKRVFGAVEGRNYQGWPRKRWVDDILKLCNMTLQQASHHAQDRVKWKNLIAGPYGSWTTGQEEEEEEEEEEDAADTIATPSSLASLKFRMVLPFWILVPAYPGCPWKKAIKWGLLLFLFNRKHYNKEIRDKQQPLLVHNPKKKEHRHRGKQVAAYVAFCI